MANGTVVDGSLFRHENDAETSHADWEIWSGNVPSRVKYDGVMVSPRGAGDRFGRPIYTFNHNGLDIYFIVLGERAIIELDKSEVQEVLNHRKSYLPIWRGDIPQYVCILKNWLIPNYVGEDAIGRSLYQVPGSDRYFIVDTIAPGQNRFVLLSNETYEQVMDTPQTGQPPLILEG